MRILQHKNIIKKLGFALPLVLFSLVAISLIGVISVKISLVDENLGRNQTDRNISKQMADLALVDAIDDILCSVKIDGTSRNDSSRIFYYNAAFIDVQNDTCSLGRCGAVSNDNAAPLWHSLQTASSTDLGFAQYGEYTGRNAFNNDINGTAKAPRYIIESVQTKVFTGNQENDARQYRITAVGYGRYSDKIFTKLQILYSVYNQQCGYNKIYTRLNHLETLQTSY